MRDLRYVKGTSDEHQSMELDNLLLVVAQTGIVRLLLNEFEKYLSEFSFT